MKAKLEFNLPEDQAEFDEAINGGKWKQVVWEIQQFLRKEIKYNDKVTEEQYQAYRIVQDELYNKIAEYGLIEEE
jgi:hypothetical protein